MAGNGGKRPGAGRKPGSKSKATLEKERVLAEVRQRIMKNAERILGSQLSIANGQQFLFRIDTDDKGRKSKPILIEDQETIQAFLDGEFGDGETLNDDEHFYFITTKEPNNQAIDSMFNRVFGKPTESMDMKLTLPKPILDNVLGNSGNAKNSKTE